MCKLKKMSSNPSIYNEEFIYVIHVSQNSNFGETLRKNLFFAQKCDYISSVKEICSVADPVPLAFCAFLTPGSGMEKNPDPG